MTSFLDIWWVPGKYLSCRVDHYIFMVLISYFWNVWSAEGITGYSS